MRETEGGLVIDVSFATPPVERKVRGWRVIAAETLSDHKYIRFDVSAAGAGNAPDPSHHLQEAWTPDTTMGTEASQQGYLNGSLGRYSWQDA